MKKWIFYKVVCILDIIALITIIFFENAKAINDNDKEGFIILFAIGAIYLIGDILGISLVKKLKMQENISKIFFGSVVLVYVLSCIVLLLYTVTYLIFFAGSSTDNYSHSTSVNVFIGLLLILFLTLLVKVVFTIPLLNSVNKNNKTISAASIKITGTSE